MLLEMQHVGLNDAYRNGVWSSRFRGKMDDDESKVLRGMGKGGAFRSTPLGIVMTS